MGINFSINQYGVGYVVASLSSINQNNNFVSVKLDYFYSKQQLDARLPPNFSKYIYLKINELKDLTLPSVYQFLLLTPEFINGTLDPN